MVEQCELCPGVILRCVSDDRFKQGRLSVQLVRPMCPEEAAQNALLPAVLLRGTENAPDLRDITLRLDDLYGASVGALVRRVGDYQTTGLQCSFMEEKYALEGDQVLAPMVAFLEELLYHPLKEDGVFCSRYLESEKKNLIAAIEAQRNDKAAYAAGQLLKTMCQKDSFGIPRLGEVSQVQQITAQSAWSHYQRLLRESRIELFYVGAAAPETVAQLVQPMFAKHPRNYIPLPAQTPFQDGGKQKVTQTMEVAQGKLCMGFVTPVTIGSPLFAAMQVCNMVFGAGYISKLFMNVRERLSLCYDISSGYHASKGILTVGAGIDSHMDEPVQQEILTQLEHCCHGRISEEELTAAREALCSSLRSIHDSPGGIENYYATGVLSGMTLSPEAYIRAVEQVTAEQVAQAAKTLQLHTVYFLKGVQ